MADTKVEFNEITMGVEEIDTLDSLRSAATPAPWSRGTWKSHEDCGTQQWRAVGPSHDIVGDEEDEDDESAYDAALADADYITALVNVAPRLIAQARFAAVLLSRVAEIVPDDNLSEIFQSPTAGLGTGFWGRVVARLVVSERQLEAKLAEAEARAAFESERVASALDTASLLARRASILGTSKPLLALQRSMMREALGLCSSTVANRNHYQPGTRQAEDAWIDLLTRGLADVDAKGRYTVSRAGVGFALEPGESFEPGIFQTDPAGRVLEKTDRGSR